MRVVFAPDYRIGVPYQALLADALGRRGIEVSFLSDNYRSLPLFRGSRSEVPDIVHIHWPGNLFQRCLVAAVCYVWHFIGWIAG